MEEEGDIKLWLGVPLGKALGYTEPLLAQVSVQGSCHQLNKLINAISLWLGRTMVWRIVHLDCA